MFSENFRTIKSCMRLGAVYASLIDYEFKCPRSTFAIAVALESFFPNHCRMGPDEMKKLDLFSQIMIAANEYVDIGLSARMKRRRQDTFYDLLELENRTLNMLIELKDIFDQEYPMHKSVSEAFINDIVLLSSQRGDFLGKEDLYLELDSAIFEVACVGLFVKGFSLNKNAPSKNIDEIIAKYSHILLNYSSDENSNGLIIKLKSLHAISMLLKIDDDLRDDGIDKILGLPSWRRWQDANDAAIIQIKIKAFEDQVFQGCDLPSYSLNGIRLLSDWTSKLKAIINRNNTPNEIPIAGHRYFRDFSTTLRHELKRSNTLDVFCDT
jgi:hypothetical protein